MGTGKTTVGQLIAQRLGREFIDMDRWIEERAGKSVAAIFAEDGEERFRAWEAEACEALSEPRGLIIATGEATRTNYERSDFCPVPRAGVILEAMTAFVLADALIEKLGGDSLSEMKPRFDQLRQARLEDLLMDNVKWKF